MARTGLWVSFQLKSICFECSKDSSAASTKAQWGGGGGEGRDNQELCKCNSDLSYNADEGACAAC